MSWCVFILVLWASVCYGSATDPRPYCSPGPCGPGEKLHPSEHCILCDIGTYMSYKGHACRTCFPCSVLRSPHEKIASNCTDKRDAYIVCIKGYFTTGPNTATTRLCAKCRRCLQDEYTLRNCTESQDTVCRPAKTMSTATLEESTSIENYSHTTQTTNMAAETIGSLSVNTTTGPAEAKTDSSTAVIAIVVSLSVIIIFVALGVIFWKLRSKNGEDCILLKW